MRIALASLWNRNWSQIGIWPIWYWLRQRETDKWNIWGYAWPGVTVNLWIAFVTLSSRLIKLHFSCKIVSLWIVLNLYFYSSYREICNFSQRCGLGWEQEQEKKMQIKIKFFIRYLWLLSLSTILTLWLFYMRWTHVRHMNATKLRWAKPYTYLNFQFPLLYALYDW